MSARVRPEDQRLSQDRNHFAASRQSRSKALLDDVRTLFQVLHDAPELNPSNYDHDQACELNVAMCEAFVLCRDLLNRVSSNAESEVSE